jgi:hypothetical protein
MNGYELISPKTGKPCGVFVCGVCNLVTHADLVEKCCKPCDCGKPSRNRFECKCSDCAYIAYTERRAKDLVAAELVEWDGSMIFSEEVSGCRDGWFDSPDDLLDYLADEEEDNKPEFAFLGRKCVNELNISRAVEQMTEDTYEDAELHIADADWKALLAAVDAFNAKYAVTYYEHDYKQKVRIDRGKGPLSESMER